MNLGVPELLIIALVIFLLFGATRLPNAARSLGRSMRIFKSEMDEMKNDKDQVAQDPAVTDPANPAIAQADPQAPVAGETPEQTRMRLQAQQQAQHFQHPQQPQQAQPQVDPNAQNNAQNS